jgi:hypothetical protein
VCALCWLKKEGLPILGACRDFGRRLDEIQTSADHLWALALLGDGNFFSAQRSRYVFHKVFQPNKILRFFSVWNQPGKC